MSIAIHLSVYLRYIDSINRPLLQYIIELFNVKSYLQTFNKYSRWRLDVYCYSLVCYLRYIDSINRPLLQNIIERFNVQCILKHSICIRDGG